MNNIDEVKQLYSEALRIREILAQNNSETNIENLANIQMDFGCLLYNSGSVNEAEDMFVTALANYERITNSVSDFVLRRMVAAFDNLAIIYNSNSRIEETMQMIFKENELLDILTEKDKYTYLPQMAYNWGWMGNLWLNLNENIKAKNCYSKSVEIYEETRLSADNDQLDLMSNIYSSLAEICENQNEIDNAKEMFVKALSIREELVKLNPENYTERLAGVQLNFGCFCYRNGILQEAEDLYRKAADNYSILVQNTTDCLLVQNYANTLQNIGLICSKTDLVYHLIDI